ncbi:RNY1, partial [Candida margitis]|uniref:RNY1 n=1 Tax=Candida margitis TaxID=1775924 RepID=UPI002226EBAA
MDIDFKIDGDAYNQYSEDNVNLNESIAADVMLNYMHETFEVSGYGRYIHQSTNLPKSFFKSIVDVIEETIGDLYVKNNGNNWKREKKMELKEPGLIFVLFTDPKTSKVVAFICFKLCLEDENNLVLYLYEIHVTSDHQGQGLGQYLIDQFHKLCVDLSNSSNLLYRQLSGTALTVFSDNERALSWYSNMGYKLTDDSPSDKLLRNGKVRKPDYYLLKRRTSGDSSSDGNDYPVQDCSNFIANTADPWSCHNTSVIPAEDQCCFEDYGILLQTQFWDFNTTLLDLAVNGSTQEVVEAEVRSKIEALDDDIKRTFTIHGLWNDLCNGSYNQYCNPDWEVDDSKDNLTYLIGEEFKQPELLKIMKRYWVNTEKSNVEDQASIALWEH